MLSEITYSFIPQVFTEWACGASLDAEYTLVSAADLDPPPEGHSWGPMRCTPADRTCLARWP